jgi:type I restriction enzyme, S subunit
MNKPTEKGLVPELRFPEFRGEWIKTTLGDVADYANGKAHEQDIDEKGRFIVVNSKFISTEGQVVKYSNASNLLACTNDILMVLSDVPNGRAISKCFYVESDDTYTVNQRICKLTSKKSISKFLFSLLDRNPYFLSFDDGVKQTNLKNDDVLNCPLVIPKDSKEQQKIADCLSSLDKLVNAHNQKLDALKAHKKGLMQQLFPAEGETVPKLRFPEFEGDGDWCFYDLGSKAKKVGSGITPKGGDKNYKSAGVPFVRSQNIGWGSLLLDNIAYIEEEVHQSFLGTEIKENDVLLNITGASIGRSAIADQRVTSGNVNQHVCIIRTKIKELHPVYLCQFILSPNGQLQIDSFQAGGNREGLNFAQIRSFSIPIPPNVEEQKKIADGLSSIDELITAQSKKIDALKAHKKGLMQQLFPKVNEVSA